MKNFHIAILLAVLLLLAACQVSPETNERIMTGLKEVKDAIDTNADGKVTIKEVGNAGTDPTTWIAIGTALLGAMFGIGKANASQNAAAKAQKDTDELYDRTHTANAPAPVVAVEKPKV